MISRTIASAALAVVVASSGALLLTGCPDNSSKPGATPAASGSANTATAPAASGSAKTGSGW
jgi:hypothetical protein